MTIKRKPFSVALNEGEKRIITIAATLDSKFPPQFCRDVSLDAAKKLIAEHEKNSAPRQKKDALENAMRDYDNK